MHWAAGVLRRYCRRAILNYPVSEDGTIDRDGQLCLRLEAGLSSAQAEVNRASAREYTFELIVKKALGIWREDGRLKNSAEMGAC